MLYQAWIHLQKKIKCKLPLTELRGKYFPDQPEEHRHTRRSSQLTQGNILQIMVLHLCLKTNL